MDRRDRRGLLRFLIPTVLLLVCTSGAAAAPAVDSETCVDCHDGYKESLGGGAHQLSMTPDASARDVSCAGCHLGGAAHIEDPSVENITNFVATPPSDQAQACSQCHRPCTDFGIEGLDPHAGQDIGCADCHRVHSSAGGLEVDQAAGMCDQCHAGVVREFQRRSNHPVNDGVLSCVSCHDLTGEAEPDFGHGGNANCYSCHPEQSGPYSFEHEAGSSFGPEGDGCNACHSPHGSSNERLLVQPDERLCRQCHGEPPRHRTQHGGIAVGFDCLDCHSEVHGSYDNRWLLDPQLGAKLGTGPGSCYCHNVEN